MSERKHQVFGDWRDLRGAVEAADPTWRDRPEAERTALWAFVEGVIREFQPLRERCFTCGEVISSRAAYRCADCRTPHCEGCIRRHFDSDKPATRHAAPAEARSEQPAGAPYGIACIWAKALSDIVLDYRVNHTSKWARDTASQALSAASVDLVERLSRPTLPKAEADHG